MPNAQEPLVHVGKASRILLAELGLDRAAVLRRSGLPTGLLDGDGTKVTLAQYHKLWASLTQEAADPQLALKLGDASGIDYFDPAFFAAMCSPNTNIAIARLADYKKHFSPFKLEVKVAAQATHVTLSGNAHHSAHPTLALTEIVFLVNFIRRATRHRVLPQSVSMPFDVPGPAAFTAHFGRPVVRGDNTTLTLSAEDATRPFVTHNDDMWALFEPQFRRQIADTVSDVGIRTKVLHCLNEFLPSGRATVEDVARELAMSKRTLQRRLAEDGTNWLDVMSDAREALAKHYLTTTDYGTTEVSFLLGYEHPNSFFRAFKRWEDTSPEHWRQQNKPQPAVQL